MNREVLKILNTIPIFSGINQDRLEEVICGSNILIFAQGEHIIPVLDGKRQLVIILSGKAQIFSNDEDRNVILRSLSKGDIFGIIGLFDDLPAEISRVIAKTACKTLFVPPESFATLLESDTKMALNYMHFLEKRIRFLNKKIICYTAGTAERRLAYYLDSIADERNLEQSDEAQKITLDVPIASLALTLGIGRASLYRAVNTLTHDGFVKKDGKDFLLFRRSEMLHKYIK